MFFPLEGYLRALERIAAEHSIEPSDVMIESYNYQDGREDVRYTIKSPLGQALPTISYGSLQYDRAAYERKVVDVDFGSRMVCPELTPSQSILLETDICFKKSLWPSWPQISNEGATPMNREDTPSCCCCKSLFRKQTSKQCERKVEDDSGEDIPLSEHLEEIRAPTQSDSESDDGDSTHTPLIQEESGPTAMEGKLAFFELMF